VVLSNGTLWTK